jgi:CDGSH-type Zn-finger protein
VTSPADPFPATITPYRDGPYVVRGAFKVVDETGRELDLGRRTIALCRCGKSRMRPLCDGTHRSIGFRAPGSAEEYAGPVRLEATARFDDAPHAEEQP